jgi:hypothetical protein
LTNDVIAIDGDVCYIAFILDYDMVCKCVSLNPDVISKGHHKALGIVKVVDMCLMPCQPLAEVPVVVHIPQGVRERTMEAFPFSGG